MKFLGVQNTTFDENPHENEKIRLILGCAISSIARAKHGCTGGWLTPCRERHFRPCGNSPGHPESKGSFQGSCQHDDKVPSGIFTTSV